ncbi:anti-sigma factor RsbA family regulatory protein [Kitasatospora sp. NPDC101801]|uniref:anti-sigma factor RsbA family regulatory protein n=1 Tax=Kitasatospora sp. NPDC101801 TaxID=3364103 RepID=UPI003800C276
MSKDGTTATAGTAGTAFRHELYPYDGNEQFVAGAMAFIDDARAGDELVLVAVAEPKERILRRELAGTGSESAVTFLDTAALGRNPGRLIPAWQGWIAEHTAAGYPVRGISEAPWNDRSPAESSELRYHEWLLNLAFAQSPAWWLLCPYDTTTLEPGILEAAGRCHPLVLHEGAHGPNGSYLDEPFAFTDLSPSPCDPAQELPYRRGNLAAVRAKVTDCADANGLDGARLRELLIAVSEVASNSIRHGGGHGVLRTWVDGADLVCEFRDRGHLADPLAGRARPTVDQIGGRGLWLVHQLCDLVEIRSTPEAGTTIRLHVALPR